MRPLGYECPRCFRGDRIDPPWLCGECEQRLIDSERKSEAAVQNQEQQREPIAHSEKDDQKDQTVTPQKRPEEAPKERE
jgi:hypothetical protein